MKKLKTYGRKMFDGLFCKHVNSKMLIGEVDSWFVLTDQLSNAIIYSAGVGKDISFETAIAETGGCQIFLYDPSPTGSATINRLGGRLPRNIVFSPIGLSAKSEVIKFAYPADETEGSFTVIQKKEDRTASFQCEPLSKLAEDAGHKYVELLKLDIEGFEYEVIDEVLNSNISVRQIAVEFHHFFPNISVWKTLKTIRLLKRKGYRLIHKRGTDYLFYNPRIANES